MESTAWEREEPEGGGPGSGHCAPRTPTVPSVVFEATDGDKHRYKQLKEDEAKAVWVRQYEDSRSTRVRKLHLLRGLVLPVWGVVENALLATAAKQGGNNGKKLRVARLLVRGADLGADGSGPQDPSNKEDGAAEEARLVGILVPRDSLKEVLQGLLQQQEHLKLHSAELVAQAAMAAAANTALVKTAATADECADRDSAGSKRRRLDGGGAEEPRCKRVLRPRAQEGSSGYESGSEQEPPFPATRQTRGRAMGGAWAEGSRRETRSSAKASQPKGKRIVRKRHAKSTVLVSSDSEEEDEAAQ